MTRAVPWSIKGIDFDAREAAKEAARRDGVTLGEWMNRAIAECAAENGVDAEDFDADERLEAVAAQLARLSHEADEDRPRRRRGESSRRPETRERPRLAVRHESYDWGDDAPGLDARRRPSAFADRSRARKTYGDDESRRFRGRAESAFDAEDLLEQAVSAFQDHAGRAEARTARALADVAQMIESAESDRSDALAQVDARIAGLERNLQRGAVRPLQGVMSSVNERLAEIESRLSGREHAPQRPARSRPRAENFGDEAELSQLDARLSGMLARIEKAEATPPGDERDDKFNRLERRFDALMARLDRQTAQPAAARPGFGAAISEIAAHQRALDSGAAPRARAAAPPLAALIDERFEALAKKLDRVTETPAPQAPPLAALLDERFDALAQKLERAREKPAAAPAEDGRIDRLQSGIESLSGRIEEMRREFASSSARAGAANPGVEAALRELTARVEAVLASPASTGPADLDKLRAELAIMSAALADVAPRGAVAGVENALRDLGRRVEQAQDAMQRASETVSNSSGAHVERALRDLTGRIDSVLDRPAGGVSVELDDLRSEMAFVSRALSEVAPRDAVVGVERALRDLTGRVDQAIASPAASSPDALDGLRGELSAIGRALSEVAPRGAVASLESAMRELANRVEQSRDAMLRAAEAKGQPTSPVEIETLSRQVAAMSRALEDVAPRSQMASLENAVRALGERIERSRDEGLRETVLGPIESIASELRRAMAEAGANANFEGMTRQLRDVQDKIETLRHAGGADRADFLQVCDQSDQLRAMIAQAVEQTAPMQRIEQQVADLSDRLSEVARQTRESGKAQEIGLAQSAAGWRGLESRLDDLASRIDRVSGAPAGAHAAGDDSRFDDLSRRLDFVHQALAARIDEAANGDAPSPGQPTIEPLLRSLAEKIDTAMAPQADSRAIEALERQMAKVSERLDHAGPQSGAEIERAFAELAQRLESSRDADREATRMALREMIAEMPGSGASVGAHEIAELREKQDASERRSQQTLTAVHETLEKVVDRLALLEEDVVEARAGHVGADFHGPDSVLPSAAAVKAAAAGLPPLAAPRAPAPVEALELMEPGAGYPGERRSKPRTSAYSADIARDDLALDDLAHDDPARAAAVDAPHDLDAPAVTLSRDDEEALRSRPAQANYIEVARRALAARAAAEAAEKAELEQAKREKSGNGRAAAFQRPLAAGERATARRLPALLLMSGAVLAFLAYAGYRTFDGAPAPATASAVGVDKPQAAPSAPAVPAPAPADAAPATPAPAAAPGKGASLGIDPLAVGAINANGAVRSGASFVNVRDLAEKGDAAAQYDLGARLAEGRSAPRDPAAAVGWFEKAAAQGSAPAQYRLGAIYEKANGAPRDLKKARNWYEKSAVAGNIRAMHNLAVIEAEGVDGKPDYTTAAQWFRRAAEYGVRDSQYNLAILYARGMGVAQNMAQSYVWFALAAKQGDEDAGKKRDEIAARLDATALGAAKKQVEEFRSRSVNAAANTAPSVAAAPPSPTFAPAAAAR